ncbi:N-acylethanolamine-hydrolyzing acid amidase-like [Styela clava]
MLEMRFSGFLNVFVIALCLWKSSTCKDALPAKRFKVNLDADPLERWEPVLKNFDVSLLRDVMDTLLKEYVKNEELIALAEVIAKDLERYFPHPYGDEIRGISNFYNMKLGDLVLENLAYDLSAWNSNRFKGRACTSIVTVDENGGLIHARNLDYVLGDELRKITAEIEFHKSGETVFIGTTYVGYVGLLTAAKPNKFSLSGDQRNTGFLWENILAALEKSWPTMLMAREVVTKADNYESAIDMLQNAKTIAPIYFIVGGLKPQEGAIVVRDRWGAVNVTRMIDTSHKWFVVETNYDPWKTPPSTDHRRDAAVKSMSEFGQDKMNPDNLYKVMSTPPVFNSETTYTTVMSAANVSLYHTMIRWDHPTEN